MARKDVFESFYRAHYVAVLRFAERRLSDQEFAREVCAETFVIAWRKFDPIEPFALTWLYKTARNLIGNAYKKRARERELVTRMHQEALLHHPSGDADLVSEAMSELSESEGDVLRLTYWEDLTAAEVGMVLGCSEQAAWKRISRAKSALRAVIERTRTAERIEAAP